MLSAQIQKSHTAFLQVEKVKKYRFLIIIIIIIIIVIIIIIIIIVIIIIIIIITIIIIIIIIRRRRRRRVIYVHTGVHRFYGNKSDFSQEVYFNNNKKIIQVETWKMVWTNPSFEE